MKYYRKYFFYLKVKNYINKIYIKKFISFLLCFISVDVFAVKDIDYKKIITKKNQIIHVIEVNPKKFDIISAHASILNSSKTHLSIIAKHLGAIVAVNGGFFRFNEEKNFFAPAGILKTKNKWHGIAYKNRAAIGWSNNKKNDNQVLVDIVQTVTRVNVQGKKYKINYFNPLKKYKKNSVFSHTFKVPINKCNLKFSKGKISNVNMDKLNLKENEYLFCYNQEKICPFSAKNLKQNATLMIEVIPLMDSSKKHKWQEFEYIVGGSPLLVFKGKKIVNYAIEKLPKDFLVSPHGRTAIGILPNKNWVFVVVEENAFFEGSGFSIFELATFMHDLGCYYALNLDGGSSTSLYILDRIESAVIKDFFDINSWHIRPITDVVAVIPKN